MSVPGTDEAKRAAAARVVELVQDGMVVGLGSGSTAEIAVSMLGERSRQGLKFSGVPTSERTARLATGLGIPLVSLDSNPRLDVSIDGADEVDPELNLIKGHGGALLREKLVAEATNLYAIVVDEGKLVDRLGQRFPVPIEVIRFAWTTTRARLEALGLTCRLRGADDPYITDGGNYILDCVAHTGLSFDRPETAAQIKLQTGVVEHGLFLGMANLVAIGHQGGQADILRRVSGFTAPRRA